MEKIIFAAEMETQAMTEGGKAVVGTLEEMKGKVEELKTINEGLKVSNRDLAKTIDTVKRSSDDLKNANRDLGKQTKELEKDLKFQEAELKRIDKELKNVNRSTQQGRQEAAALSRQKRELQKDLAATAAQITKNNAAVVENTNRMRQNEAQAKALTAQIKNNTDALRTNEVAVKKGATELKNLEKASGGAAGAVGKVWGGLRTLANVLPGVGIAGLIGLMTDFTLKLFQSGEGLDSLAAKRKILNEVIDKAAESSSKDVAQIEIFRQKLNDTNISQAERIRVAKEYNKVADEQNQIDLTQINNLQLINEKLDAQIKLIMARAVALSATAKLGEFADPYVEAQLNLNKRIKETGFRTEEEFRAAVKEYFTRRNNIVQQFIDNDGQLTRAQLSRLNQSIDKEIIAKLGGIDAENLVLEVTRTKGNLDKAAQLLSGLITPEGLTTKTKTPTGSTAAAPENVFQQKLAELRQRLTQAQLAEFQSEPLIQAKFAAQLDKEFLEIGKLIKDKRLTIPQGDILKGLLKQINELDLTRSLEEFRTRQREAIERVNNLLLDAHVEAANKRIANIRDDFERERSQIEQNYEQTTAALSKRLQDLQKKVNDDVKKGLLTEEQGADRNAALAVVYGDLATQAGVARFNAHLELSFKMFQETIKQARRTMEEALVDLSEGATGAIQIETQRFTAGEITYAQYQKRITKILKDEAAERRKIQLKELEEELARLNSRLQGTTDEQQRRQLEDQRRGVRGQIANLSREIANEESKDENDTNNKRIQNIIAYANAVNGLLQQIASFWQQVNAIEQASLERSIALQEKRVENAREIAEKGNAEYLEQEQKRLDELERKREANAQKQIAINNALTASQAIVAMIGAIAQATATGSPIAAIGAVAATIGAIAAAYAFVNSLQPQSTQFYQGSEYVDDPKAPRGKDTVKARLNIGERVVTTDKNQAYWDTLTAIHNGTVPPDALNKFVNAYTKGNLPMIDFLRLNEATNGKLGHDSIEVARKLDTTNEILHDVVDAVGSIAFAINLDEHGLAASIQKSVRRHSLRKKA